MSDAQAYPNRSDLRNPAAKMAATAAPGQTYGEAGAQIAAQQAVPMGASPASAAAQQAPRPVPGQVADLMAPTNYPDRPMSDNFTAPDMQRPYRFGDPTMELMRQLYLQYPNDDLLYLLNSYDRYYR